MPFAHGTRVRFLDGRVGTVIWATLKLVKVRFAGSVEFHRADELVAAG